MAGPAWIAFVCLQAVGLRELPGFSLPSFCSRSLSVSTIINIFYIINHRVVDDPIWRPTFSPSFHNILSFFFAFNDRSLCAQCLPARTTWPPQKEPPDWSTLSPSSSLSASPPPSKVALVNVNKFFYWSRRFLPGFTAFLPGVNWVLLGFTGFYWVFNWAWPSTCFNGSRKQKNDQPHDSQPNLQTKMTKKKKLKEEEKKRKEKRTQKRTETTSVSFSWLLFRPTAT